MNFIEEEIESLKVEHKRGDNIDHVRGAISAYTAMYEFLKSDMILPG